MFNIKTIYICECIMVVQSIGNTGRCVLLKNIKKKIYQIKIIAKMLEKAR